MTGEFLRVACCGLGVSTAAYGEDSHHSQFNRTQEEEEHRGQASCLMHSNGLGGAERNDSGYTIPVVVV